MTPETIRKLEEAFSWGCSDREAVLHANIGLSTMQAYCKENPEFRERKETLKESPLLRARQTIVNSLGKLEPAQWYAERKSKSEFSTRSEHTGGDGAPLFNFSEEAQKRMKKYE